MASIGVTKDSDSSLMSYLLFEKGYCGELIDAGYADGMAQQEKIKEFLNIQPTTIRQKHINYDRLYTQ